VGVPENPPITVRLEDGGEGGNRVEPTGIGIAGFAFATVVTTAAVAMYATGGH